MQMGKWMSGDRPICISAYLHIYISPHYLYSVKLSIVIVSYNAATVLKQCLQSVEAARQASSFPVDVVVVDNASVDETMQEIPSLFPEIRFIENAENIGFSRACNQGARLCSGEYLLFLNPDTVIPGDCFQKALSFLDLNLNVGALGVRMVDEQGLFLKESKRGFPGPAASFYKLFGFARLFPRSKIFSSYYAGHLKEDQSGEVEALSGAFMIIRTNLFQELDGFDESFFMYAEDIDLSHRVIQAGFSCYYFPSITITHAKGKSTVKDRVYINRFYGAMEIFVNKYYGHQPVKAAFLKAGIRFRRALALIA